MIEASKRFESSFLGEAYECIRHSSGLQIYIFPKNFTSTYALLAANIGSVDRTDGDFRFPAGVAHFLEHKLFENEDGSDSFERFSAFGADANAYTSQIRTVYLFSATERFRESLEELVRFVTHPHFKEESVKRERGIIGEEILQTEDNPYNRAYHQMLTGLYESADITDEICGTVSSIEEITPEVLYRAYEKFYTPANMVLVVCGDVQREDVLRIVDRVLPQNTRGVPVKRAHIKESSAAVRPYAETTGQVGRPIFYIGVKDAREMTSEERAKRDAGMAVLCEMIFSQSSELYNDLFSRSMIGNDFSAEYTSTEAFSLLRISGEADDPRAVLEEIIAYIEKKKKEGLSAEDFERCRRVEYAEFIKGFDSTEEIAETLLSFVMDGSELFSYADILRNLTLFDVEELLRNCFDKTYFTLSVVNPEDDTESEEL